MRRRTPRGFGQPRRRVYLCWSCSREAASNFGSLPEGWYIEWDDDEELFRHFCSKCLDDYKDDLTAP